MGKIFVDHGKKTIFASKTFLKKARSSESEEYIELADVVALYRGYCIKERHIKTKNNKQSYKGLTYRYMEKYIQCHNNPEIMMAEYRQQRMVSESHKETYGEVKSWFLENYPEVTVFKTTDFQEENTLVESTNDMMVATKAA